MLGAAEGIILGRSAEDSSMSHDTSGLGFDSKLIHAGRCKDPFGSVTVPIYQTSTFAFDSAQDGADRFAGKLERIRN